jgi:hypothetical protein
MEDKGRLLSLKDFEGIHVDPALSDFDKLVLVAELLLRSIYEAQEKEET